MIRLAIVPVRKVSPNRIVLYDICTSVIIAHCVVVIHVIVEITTSVFVVTVLTLTKVKCQKQQYDPHFFYYRNALYIPLCQHE